MRSPILQAVILCACAAGAANCSSAGPDEVVSSSRLALSSVLVSGITPTSAVVTWSTNLTSTSIVEYGLSTSYGSATPLYGLTLEHEIPLTDLSPAKLYHFRVTSADAQASPVSSSDFTFTTLYADGGAPDAAADSGGAAKDGGAPPSPVNGVCGSANGVAVSQAPSTNLCMTAASSPVTGSGPFTWTCAGSNGGSTASCSAPLLPSSAACGSSNGAVLSAAPTTGLCDGGTVANQSGAGPWFWACTGGGTTVNCSASSATSRVCAGSGPWTAVSSTQSIASVIKSAASGATLIFAPGTYGISSPITLPSNISLQGQSGVVFNYTGAASGYGWLTVSSASNVNICGITFDGGSDSPATNGTIEVVDGNNTHIISNTFLNSAAAIHMWNSDNFYFQGNTAVTNETIAIDAHLTDGNSHSHMIITDNKIGSSSFMGLQLQNNSAATVGFQDVHVDRNIFTTWNSAPWSNNIAISMVTGAATACNTVWGNTFNGTPGTGAWAIELGAENTSIEQNVMTGIDEPIFFSSCPGSEFENNSMTDTGSFSPYNEDGSYNDTQWVGVNTIKGVSTTGWAAQPNTGAKPVVCSPSAAF